VSSRKRKCRHRHYPTSIPLKTINVNHLRSRIASSCDNHNNEVFTWISSSVSFYLSDWILARSIKFMLRNQMFFVLVSPKKFNLCVQRRLYVYPFNTRDPILRHLPPKNSDNAYLCILVDCLYLKRIYVILMQGCREQFANTCSRTSTPLFANTFVREQ
jgi:hypothetical protein